jgi:hypothetical protein
MRLFSIQSNIYYYMNEELTEQYLNGVYDNVMREHTRLLNDMKNTSTEMGKNKEKDITKHLSLLNNLMTSLLKLRNVKKDIKSKADR